jgi:phage terminase small subunit
LQADGPITGSRLLTNVDIQNEIQEAMDRRAEKVGITAERVLNELALLGFANMLDYIKVSPNGSALVDLSKLTRDQAAAIGEITVEEFIECTGQDEWSSYFRECAAAPIQTH